MRHLVASGALRPGDALPSVRDLAREQRINPNTVAKAYQRLAEAGILETRRGEGTFVAERPPAMPAAERARLLREGATRLATLAVNLGATRAEAVSALQAAWPTSRRRREAGDERGDDRRRGRRSGPGPRDGRALVSYGRTRVVDGLTLAVPRGSVFALLGRNGAGKSSLLRVLLGQRPAGERPRAPPRRGPLDAPDEPHGPRRRRARRSPTRRPR